MCHAHCVRLRCFEACRDLGFPASLHRQNGIVSRATNTSALEPTESKLTRLSPLPPAFFHALFVTSSFRSLLFRSFHPPISILFNLPPKPPVVILDPPLSYIPHLFLNLTNAPRPLLRPPFPN